MIYLKDYEILDKIRKYQDCKLYRVINTKTGKKHTARVLLFDINNLSSMKTQLFFNEIRISSKINHPSFLKFNGYSLSNFKQEPKPVIINENVQNFTLSDFKLISILFPSKKLNLTQKLIIIYGVAAGMSYLHSHDIVHRLLNTENIYIDENYFPKIYGLKFVKETPPNSNESTKLPSLLINEFSHFISPPETKSSFEYGKPSDVFIFSLIVLELIGKGLALPEFQARKSDLQIPMCYQNLIQQCSLTNPNKRPTFDEIVIELKTNPDFLKGVNRDEYFNYIKFIDDSQKSYETNEKFQSIESILYSHIIQRNEAYSKIRQFSQPGVIYDLEKYKSNPSYSLTYEKKFSDMLRFEFKKFVKMVNIMYKIDHPAILKYIGYYSSESETVIVTENFGNDISKCQLDPLYIIYGIASAMSFLHSHNIIHRDLKPQNIVLDEFNLPKITGFKLAKEIKDDCIHPNKKIKGTPLCIAPEVYNHEGYSKACDVYSFSILMYYILTNSWPYSNCRKLFGIRIHAPFIDHSILRCYRQLIERCWSHDPKKRPTFDEILHELKSNPEFIESTIDKENFIEYAKYIDGYPSTFDPSKQIKQLDDIPTDCFPDIKPNILKESDYETEINNVIFNEADKIIQHHVKQDIEGNFYDIKIINDSLISRTAIKEYDNFFQNEIINFSRELNILLQIKHPSILEFYGYGLNGKYPKILCKYSRKGTLGKILENERINNSKNKMPAHKLYFYQPPLKLSFFNIIDQKDEEEDNLYYKRSLIDDNRVIESLTDTQKLIIIYGIASGMAYLHYHNIIHRDLKPHNIYLDDNMYPKIFGFNISKIINDNLIKPNKKIKGTPIYVAPEVYLNEGYSKSSDVYSFALIMYEILTGEIPYSNLQSPREIKKYVVDENRRPVFKYPIMQCYRQLIERCWSFDKNKRPTFDEIVYEIRTNPDFITNKIDIQEYQAFINYINASEISFNSSNKIEQLEEFIKFKLNKFKQNKSKINLRNIYETETNNILLDYDFIDIKIFKEKEKIILENEINYICPLKDEKTGKEYIGKIYKEDLSHPISRINDINELLNDIIDLHHPTLLNFVGYSPINLKNETCAVIIYEGASNFDLERLIEIEKRNKSYPIFNETKKLICIFGIALGMSYLNSHNLINYDLHPCVIFLDDFLYPKIGMFNKIDIKDLKIMNQKKKIGQHSKEYDAFDDACFEFPEDVVKSLNSTEGDVYIFGLILYNIVTGKDLYLIYDKELLSYSLPKFKETIPKCYIDLIVKCLSLDPRKRPTFDEIINELKTNPEFITINVDEEEFQNYIEYIEEAQFLFEIKKEELKFEDFVAKRNKFYPKIKIDQDILHDLEKKNLAINIEPINLDDFKKVKKIGSGSFGNVYKIIDKNTDNIYAAKILNYEIDECSESIITDFSREVNNISILDHPAILKFIGYSPFNFKKVNKPVIITEYAKNKSLDKIIELEYNGFGNSDWNDTKKLINIYGIASGMRYLHKLNIIHRDLKPANILLDENLYPKIADFGLSKNIFDYDVFKDYTLTQSEIVESSNKGTYFYFAPEIFSHDYYSKQSDIYAFGSIVHEILTSKSDLKGFNLYQLLNVMKDCINYRNVRKIDPNIPYCFKKLISSCWKNEPYERPSFKTIVEMLENNPSFITKNVNKEEYFNYISFVKESLSHNYSIGKKLNISTDNSNENNEFIEDECDENDCFLDLSKFDRKYFLQNDDILKVCQICEKQTNKIYSAQLIDIKYDQMSKKEKEKLSQNLDLFTKINYPSLLKFIGFSPLNFKKEYKPIIVTESISNDTLPKILNSLDNSMKFVTIFCIASGMSYLHSLGIVHRALTPASIYFDDDMLPKVEYFIHSLKGNYQMNAYSAPEVIKCNAYSKMSDVYSFGMIVYEIITNQKPFKEIETIDDLINEVVVKNIRPKFEKEILQFYKNLIIKCWNDNPNERPTFDDIVYYLEMNSDLNCDHSLRIQKYIELLESQNNETLIKIDEKNDN